VSVNLFKSVTWGKNIPTSGEIAKIIDTETKKRSDACYAEEAETHFSTS